MKWITADRLFLGENYFVVLNMSGPIGDSNVSDRCLSALARAWITTFVATTLLVTALAMASVWDRTVYLQALQDVVTTDPL